ncbi:helix-turn-helix transcriptional regulator [Castellaniella sp.]|uniref:helix-turn-helix domain-containing protein n=1 Tax=Castellaniella sp. TaxID=1955812 RepID=UPI002AFDE86A|nr:helix-turn-helix transcriptional regulator [Castellaniella sp.]
MTTKQSDQNTGIPADLLARFKSPLTHYGVLVRALRIVADTTLQEMATYMDTTPATLSGMEFGYREPSYMDLCAMRDFFQAKGLDVSFGLLSQSLHGRQS